MKVAPLPHNEVERLKALAQLELLDTLPEEVYDEITRLASEICGTPVAYLTLIDEKRQWFKSKYGSVAKETPRDQSFCAHAILNPDEVFIVPDARYDERFYDNPAIMGEPPVIFYAGVPIKDANDNAIGSLCVIDSRPRELSLQKIESLKALAILVNAHFELRKSKIELRLIHSSLKRALVYVNKSQGIVDKLIQSEPSVEQIQVLTSLEHTIEKIDFNLRKPFSVKNSNKDQLLLKDKRILVAEDNEVNQKVIQNVLQRAGGIVDIANHGLEAIAFLKKSSKYDLIIMDLQMDEMDGYAATLHIRNVLKLSIPIIAMTATEFKGEREKCIEAGMNDYLTKPFDFDFLYNRINQLLKVDPINDSKMIMPKQENVNLYDLSILEEMGHNKYIAEILGMFLTDTPERLKEIREASIADQFIIVHKAAHKLKSSVGLLKANDLLNVIKKLEEMGKAENKEGLVALVDFAIEKFKEIEAPLIDQLKILNQA